MARATGNRREISNALNSLGYVLFSLGQHAEARLLLEESLAEKRASVGLRYSAAIVLLNLGHVAEALGADHDAQAYFGEAVQIASEIRAISAALDGLVGQAKLFAKAGETERAIELAALALHHPATWKETTGRAAQLLAGLERLLPPDVVAAALARGRASTWDEIAMEARHAALALTP